MELVEIGYFSKTHGTKGELLLKYTINFFTEELNAIFINTATGKAPYFVAEIKSSNHGLIVALEDIDSIEKAKIFVGKTIFISSEFVDSESESFNWIGFEVIDNKYGSLGNIINYSDNGAQELITVNYKSKEIILPFVEELVEKIDEAKRQIFYKSPEGLVDIYIS